MCNFNATFHHRIIIHYFFPSSFVQTETLRQILPVSILLVGTAVAQLVEALRYKSEGRGFDSHGIIGIFH